MFSNYLFLKARKSNVEITFYLASLIKCHYVLLASICIKLPKFRLVAATLSTRPLTAEGFLPG